jgi:hypothetical protein
MITKVGSVLRSSKSEAGGKKGRMLLPLAERVLSGPLKYIPRPLSLVPSL